MKKINLAVYLLCLSTSVNPLFSNHSFALSVIPSPQNKDITTEEIAQNNIERKAQELFDEGAFLYEDQQHTTELLLESLNKFEQALILWRKIEDKENEAHTLLGIGLVYNDLGEKEKALDFCNQALSFYQAIKDKEAQSFIIEKIANIYDDLGEKEKALDYYNQTLTILRALEYQGFQADTLNNIGDVYNDLGEKEKALDYYNQALSLYRAVGDKEAEATTLDRISSVDDDLDEK